MEVSIIIPVYNAEKYVARCLDSLFQQTVQDFEIICIDDCGTDDSKSILYEYQQKYPDQLIILENKKNCGAGQSREHGIAQASGTYLVFVDSDDYLAPDYLKTYLEAMKKHPCDIMIGGFIKDRGGRLENHAVSDSVWSVVTYPMTCAKMWKKDFITKNGIHFGTTSCAEDTYFSLTAYIHNATYHILDYEGYFYYQNPQSAIESTNYTMDHERMISKVFTNLMAQPAYRQSTVEQKQIIEYAYLANMVDSLVNYNRGCGKTLMEEKFHYVMNDLSEKFPNYLANPYVGFFKPKGQTRIIRFGVGGFCLLRRLKLDKLFFSVIARL